MIAAKPCDLWHHRSQTFCSSLTGDNTCKVSPRSVQPFQRRFSHWSDKAFDVCNYDVIITPPMTSTKYHTYFPWGVLDMCYVSCGCRENRKLAQMDVRTFNPKTLCLQKLRHWSFNNDRNEEAPPSPLSQGVFSIIFYWNFWHKLHIICPL